MIAFWSFVSTATGRCSQLSWLTNNVVNNCKFYEIVSLLQWTDILLASNCLLYTYSMQNNQPTQNILLYYSYSSILRCDKNEFRHIIALISLTVHISSQLYEYPRSSWDSFAKCLLEKCPGNFSASYNPSNYSKMYELNSNLWSWKMSNFSIESDGYRHIILSLIWSHSFSRSNRMWCDCS